MQVSLAGPLQSGAPINATSLCPLQQHYNSVITDTASSLRTLKFGLRDSATKMALHWAAPADVARGGIQKVFERARLLQENGSAGAEP